MNDTRIRQAIADDEWSARLPERAGAREGVDIVMLTSTTKASVLGSPMEVASTGILGRPLKSFTLS